VLFVGRFVEGKRPGIAVEAFAEVLEEYPDAELYLCGEGPLQGELESQVAELEIGESVTFLGHVPYDEMPKVYRSGDVLVLPSRAEGVPRTVLEAQASGLSVVTSELEQIANIIDSRWTVSIEDGEQLATVLNQRLSANLTEQERLSESLNWSDTVAKTTAVLEIL